MSSNAIEYAKALYELLPDSKSREDFLNDIISSIEIFSSDVLKFFLYPEISKEEKKKIIEKSFEKGLLRDFLFVLIDNDKFSILEEIKVEFESLIENDKKLLKVKVYSKEQLSEDYILKLKEKLTKKLSREIVLENCIDESIIGGIRISYESKEIDLTLNSKYNDLLNKLKEE